jgi:hypothetical protein
MKLLIFTVFIVLNRCFGYRKEILTPNNLDQVYQTEIQKEILASSDYTCAFRCTSNVSESVVKRKLKEVAAIPEENIKSNIQSINHGYYCTNTKPLYIVKLYKII